MHSTTQKSFILPERYTLPEIDLPSVLPRGDDAAWAALMQKKLLMAGLAVGVMVFGMIGGVASASVISYNISVSSSGNSAGWYGGLSWGIPGLPITRSISVDTAA